MRCAVFVGVLAVAAYFAPTPWEQKYKVHESGGVLVTGASTGIGRHAAFAIARRTNFTVFAGVRKLKDADSVRTEAAKDGLRVIPVILDITNQSQVDTAKEEIMAHLDGTPFVGLLNNAGVAATLPIEILPVESAQWVFDVHFFGAMRITQAFLPELRKSQGRILFTNSILGHVVANGFGVYSEAKYAQRALAMQLRMELSDFGVSVSTLSPGVIATELGANTAAATQKAMEDADIDPAIMQLYPQFFACQNEKMGPIMAAADEVTVMDAGLFDALIGQTPKVEYFSSGFAGVPSWVLAGLQWFLPTRLHELITEIDKKQFLSKFVDAPCMREFRHAAPKSNSTGTCSACM